jgi:hypothetical protein
LFESLKSYDNNLYLGLINGKEEDKKTIKALIVTIKDEGLQDNREIEDIWIPNNIKEGLGKLP